jgi:hypothetical protein
VSSARHFALVKSASGIGDCSTRYLTNHVRVDSALSEASLARSAARFARAASLRSSQEPDENDDGEDDDGEDDDGEDDDGEDDDGEDDDGEHDEIRSEPGQGNRFTVEVANTASRYLPSVSDHTSVPATASCLVV